MMEPPEIGEITQEMAEEYMAVASILAMDIELLEDMIGNAKDDELRAMVAHFIERSKKVTQDKETRELRWKGFRTVYWLAHGLVPNNGQKAKKPE